jgi:hypothetical protein
MNAVPSPNPASWSSTHPITAEDKVAMAALRAMVEPLKGKLQGTAARQPFDEIMERVPAPEGVRFEADTVGGVSGWWCRPSQAKSEHVILHLHGGWFNWGSAQAFRHLVGHIAVSVGAHAFIPEYRLAPEHVFPAAGFHPDRCGWRFSGRCPGAGLVKTRHGAEYCRRCDSGRRGGAFSRDRPDTLWTKLEDPSGSGPLFR